jgi:hypothetical protein
MSPSWLTARSTPVQFHIAFLIIRTVYLHAPCARGIFIGLQAEQQLPHPLLGAPVPSSGLALAAQVDQFGDSLPRGAPCSGILSLGQKLFSLLLRLSFLLVDLPIVRFVEAVDVFLRRGDRFFLLAPGGFVAAGKVGVALFAPCADGFALFLARGRRIVCVAGERGRGAVGYCAAGADVLCQ